MTNEEKSLLSEIINNKKQLILKVDQTNDYIYPNQMFEYDIYCKNTSNDIINNVHIQIISPENVLLDEDDYNEGIEIGSLTKQESHLIRLKARCSSTGTYTVHFICYGDGTGLFTKQLTINCDYHPYQADTVHKIHIYNFNPYENTYLLQSQDYNEDVTRLRKIQKLPYQAKENPFKIEQTNLNQGSIIDESQNYLDQYDILYKNPYNGDEHSYQYIERENFNKKGVEYFEGHNLIDIFNQINDNSKLVKAKFLKTGTNHLLNDFKQYYPDGFIYRFGLMSSEIFHTIGVLPEYSYMNDVLFTWKPDDNEPLTMYPQKVAMHWDTKKWAGHGYHVYKTYTDEYKEELINKNEFTPLFKFMHSFDMKEMAQEYIDKAYAVDTTNIYYITTDEETYAIKKYQYIIKESFNDTGVFYVHIPLDKIPTNFYRPNTDEIEAIIQKTKPFGMKPLIRYISTVRFRHNMSFKVHEKIQLSKQFHLGVYDKLRYIIQSYKYNDIIENICERDINNNIITKEREVCRLIPDGKMVTNRFHFEQQPKCDIYMDHPQDTQKITMDMHMEQQGIECSLDNDLSYLSRLEELLQQNNFDNISFMIKDIVLLPINDDNQIGVESIDAVNYKLWTQSLMDETHSREWGVTKIKPNDNIYQNPQNQISYYLTEERQDEDSSIGLCDFVAISLTNKQIAQPNIETGIGFKDIKGVLHGISAEYDSYLKLFNIRYTTSHNNIFTTHKKAIANLSGLAYKIIATNDSTIIIFFIEKTENAQKTYHYFNHIIVSDIKTIFCFIRNEQNVSSIRKISNLVSIGKKTDPNIYFNTPQYLDSVEHDPYIILTPNINSWENIHRIDKNEYSYAYKHNTQNISESVDNIQIHCDNLNIPEDAIIKDINIHAIVESNADKNIYYNIRNEDGFITQESSINRITIHPNEIEAYPAVNQNQQYYQDNYNVSVKNNVTNSIKFFKNKLQENIRFDKNLNLSLNFLDDLDDFLRIKKDYWIELSDFDTQSYSFNDIEDCELIIEGYNHGSEVILDSKLLYNNNEGYTTDTLIPSGYFTKHIKLNGLNNFILDEIHLKMRFKGLNNNMDIFDIHLNTTFKEKQNTEVDFEEYQSISIEEKKVIDFSFISEEQNAYKFLNGFTVQLAFDDLEPGEYYRIYSIVLNIIYQSQSIDFSANKDNNRNLDTSNTFTVVSGEYNNGYLSGMFYNDMPSSFQYQHNENINNQGIELSDALYQSFIANSDNITSITLFPNGFVGNPNLNIKLGLYKNQGNTPNELIKEIKVSGWSKENNNLKNKTEVTYNFNVNNLTIGETYWLKISVDAPSNGYYLLKYINSPQTDFRLLSKINNNLINIFGALKFQINSIHLYKSFNNIPSSQDDLDNPNVFIGLHRGQGYIKNLKIRKLQV